MGACEKGHLGVSFLHESMGLERAASGHLGVSWSVSPRLRWLSQPAVCSNSVYVKAISDWKPSMTNTTERILPSIHMCDRLPGATIIHSAPFTHLCINFGLKSKGSETAATQHTTSRCLILYLITGDLKVQLNRWKASNRWLLHFTTESKIL